MLDAVKTHLPLIAVAAVAAVLVLYLYRELQKTKRALAAATTAPGLFPPGQQLKDDAPDLPAKRARVSEHLDPAETAETTARRPTAAPATHATDAR